MKPETIKYILDNIGRRSVKQLAAELGLREKHIKTILEKGKSKNIPKVSERTRPRNEKRPIGKKAALLLFASIIIAGFAVYFNVVNGPLIFDDEVLVEDNELIRDIHNVPVFFKKDIWAKDVNSQPVSNSYRPLQMTTYAIDHLIGGEAPFIYHLSNVLLHIVNSGIIFVLVWRVSKNIFTAYFTALLFTVHPVNTACVSYVSGRADVLSGMFMLLSVFLFVVYSEKKNKILLLTSVVSYMGAIFTKEYAILAVPLVIVMYNWTYEKRKVFDLRNYIFYAAPLAGYLYARTNALNNIVPIDLELAGFSVLPRVMTSLKTLFIDIRILLAPYDLHFGRTTKIEYSFPGSEEAVLAVIGLTMMLVTLKVFLGKWRNNKRTSDGLIFFGGSWFLVSMLPLINIVPLQAFLSDNWLYFPAIGVYLIIAVILDNVRGRFFRGRIMKGLILALVAGLFIQYGVATIERNKDYLDVVRFYLSNLKWRPSVKFYGALGDIYTERKGYDQAIKYL